MVVVMIALKLNSKRFFIGRIDRYRKNTYGLKQTKFLFSSIMEIKQIGCMFTPTLNQSCKVLCYGKCPATNNTPSPPTFIPDVTDPFSF